MADGETVPGRDDRDGDERDGDERGGERGPVEPTPQTREEAQIRLILREFGDEVQTDPPTWEKASEVKYFYRPGSVLVRDRDLARVLDLFDRRGSVDGDIINGLSRYQPPPDFDGNLPSAPSPTLQYLAYIDAQLGTGVATPDHLLYVVPDVSPCPATEPEEVTTGTGPLPGVSTEPCDGEGIRVLVVDVGWSPSAASWLAGVTGEPENPYLPPPDGTIRPYAGHGTFIAGIIRCIAPKAEVIVKGVFTRAGAAWESDLVPRLDEALAEAPDVISLSAGTRTRNDLSLMGFDVFFEERMNRVKGLTLVAAAGNDGNRGPFFPAATPGTVSVGALSEDLGHRARFSNYGGWVDVYAPGENLVNAYLTGTFRCEEPPHLGQLRTFQGMARWSGTSFATPVVTGLIAARMSGTGENSREAADSLLRLARTRAIHGVGAVLLPGQACPPPDDDHHGCGCSPCHRRC